MKKYNIIDEIIDNVTNEDARHMAIDEYTRDIAQLFKEGDLEEKDFQPQMQQSSSVIDECARFAGDIAEEESNFEPPNNEALQVWNDIAKLFDSAEEKSNFEPPKKETLQLRGQELREPEDDGVANFDLGDSPILLKLTSEVKF